LTAGENARLSTFATSSEPLFRVSEMKPPLIVNREQFAVWDQLGRAESVGIDRLVELANLNQSKVMAIALEAEEAGLATIAARTREQIVPAADAVDAVRSGVPERRAVQLLASEAGPVGMSRFVELMKREDLAINDVFRWGQTRGWLRRGKDQVQLTDDGRRAAADEALDADERAVLARDGGSIYLDETDDADRVRKLLRNRPELAKIKKRTERTVSLTDAGRAMVKAGIQVREQRNVLTPDDLRSGAWREISLRPYDVTLPAETVHAAKVHPLRKIIEQTRRAFLEMGFTEVVSPMVESSFWCFDALFQPQDHPAREMQDTFYMDQPCETALPGDSGLVERVRRVHEDGGDTGSEGWGYTWEPKRAKQAVLRTHTTAATIRALAAHPSPPWKAFCVGWVYRNESMSFKHLPVFHQVDGIIIDEHANLASLLGTLESFYRKMGFQRVKFKPAFYPYTEPSVDVVVYLESRGKWIEMGGSGIFRPEVTEPLGCRHPVLAWGLGMERLAMIRYGLTDIRELFHGKLDAMREVALCR
jgi:phenylalanyl-tRNA synthetase alpha chain